ncbi:alanine--glyoxylate aminotransferase family protein [bacterium]|nr:alanine--glyoxylate aminotransferase family protein [bacterium]
MSDQMRIMLPGPTPCPASSLRAMARPMINHRGKEFMAMLEGLTADLRWAYQTQNDVLILTTSGTGALEAAIVNMLSPGDRVLALITGEFGKRFAKIAETYGAVVDKVEAVYGEPITPEMVAEKVGGAAYKAVLVTHNETSTSLLNPLKEIAEVIRRALPDTLILVDAVSGLLTAPLPVDEWDLDVVLSGAQKAFMIPPGLAFASVSPRAWAAHAEAKMPRFYFDFTKARDFLKKGQTPWTPAISLFFALEEAMVLLKKEGLSGIFERHALMARMIRAGAKALGLRLVVENDRYASMAVTGIYPPEGISPSALRKTLQDRFGYVVAGGQGPLTDSIIRIGHCGFYDAADMLGMLAVLEASLTQLGAKIPVGAGVAAAEAELAARTAVAH